MRSQGPCIQPLGLLLAAGLSALVVARPSAGQALYSDRVGGGVELVVVSQPLSYATTFAWPEEDGSVASTTSGDLTLVADVERVLGGRDVAPPVVVAVGSVQVAVLQPLIERLLGGLPVAPAARPVAPEAEGSLDRRLGAAGDDAALRLEVTMPSTGDPRRSTVEVLWEMLPAILAGEVSGLSSRVEHSVGSLEARIDPQLAEISVRQLRLELARLAADPRLDEAVLAAARERVQVRRLARLAGHPDGAELIVDWWLDGGVAGVREFLFGVEGVTLSSAREAAGDWLPRHPGRAVLVLPPRVFNPRFAPGPERVQLVNDLVAAILERPGAGLAVLVLRPVVMPDVDGQVTGTVLARLATEVRGSDLAPGWVRVRERPSALELAATPEQFPELVETVQRALGLLAADDRAIEVVADVRRRALDLMASQLGLSEGIRLAPADLLRPSNLAIGVVAPDGEAAAEALEKFGFGGPAPASRPASRTLAPIARTREAAPGDDSVIVVRLDLPSGVGEIRAAALLGVLDERRRQLPPGIGTELLVPLVPGRSVLLLVTRTTGTLAELEAALREHWSRLAVAVTADELGAINRRLGAELAGRVSGPLGQASRCAAVAAGEVGWRPVADLEMDALTVSSDEVNELLVGLADWQLLETAGAGVLPIPDLGGD